MTKANSSNKQPFDLVIFDCDGVLVDSEVISCRAHAETLTRHGYPISEQQVLERFLGLYVSINAFSELVMKTRQRGELKRWAPRSGFQALL